MTEHKSSRRRVQPGDDAAADDDDLIFAVAQRADHGAFSMLYERYNGPAYNLAMCLTGNRALAEEAVQEAMLRIWTSAKSYESGNARGWILRIVARESLHKLKAQKKRHKQMESEHALDNLSAVNAPETGDTANAEIMQVLRGVLGQLSSDEQQLVALHYGAGLSLREMSAELTVPRQTLHNQLTKILGNLKSRLSAAGFATALPLLSPDRLSEALTTGHQCPPGVMEGIMSRIESGSLGASSGAKSLSRRALTTSKPAAGLLPVIAVTAAAVLAGGIYLRNTQAPTPPPAVPVAAPVVATPPADVPFKTSWSSTDGPADKFKVLAGDWNWQPAQGAVPGGMVVGAGSVLALVAEKAPKRPFVVTLTVRNLMGLANIEAIWCDNDAVPAFQFWTVRDTPPQPSLFEVHVVFKDDYAVTLTGKAPFTIRKFEHAYPHERIALNLKNITLVKMVGRELQPGEEKIFLGSELENLVAKVTQSGNVVTGHSDPVPLLPANSPKNEAKK